MNWFKKHKILSVVIGFVVLAGLISAASDTKSNTDTSKSSNSSSTSSSSQQAAQPAKETEKLAISNSTYSAANGLYQVTGEVKNNDTNKHSATLKATFYDASGKITGTASGAVNDVMAGETKTFTLLSTTDVTGYSNMKVQVDTML